MIKKIRVNLTEHSRWSGPSPWERDFDTIDEANAFFEKINSNLGVEAVTPEEYDTADNIYEVQIDPDTCVVYTGPRIR
jgi:hypothetical protein